MNIPYIAMEINAQRERYRVLRVNVINIVRLYNKVSHQRLLLAFPYHQQSSSVVSCSLLAAATSTKCSSVLDEGQPCTYV